MAQLAEARVRNHGSRVAGLHPIHEDARVALHLTDGQRNGPATVCSRVLSADLGAPGRRAEPPGRRAGGARRAGKAWRRGTSGRGARPPRLPSPKPIVSSISAPTATCTMRPGLLPLCLGTPEVPLPMPTPGRSPETSAPSIMPSSRPSTVPACRHLPGHRHPSKSQMHAQLEVECNAEYAARGPPDSPIFDYPFGPAKSVLTVPSRRPRARSRANTSGYVTGSGTGG